MRPGHSPNARSLSISSLFLSRSTTTRRAACDDVRPYCQKQSLASFVWVLALTTNMTNFSVAAAAAADPRGLDVAAVVVVAV